MADPRFFDVAGPFSIGTLAALSGSTVGGAGDTERQLFDVAPLDAADDRHVSFLANRHYVTALERTRAGAVIVSPALADRAPREMPLLLAADPYMAFAKVSAAFHPPPKVIAGVAETAIVDAGATLGAGVSIGAYAIVEASAEIGARTFIGAHAVIGAGVVLGEDCRIASHVTLSHCIIGARVTIFPGARIGQDGFGFASGREGHVKIPQLGRVLIGDDVEIGANTTIDRGAGPDTVVGSGCMIDNLVQIGHNVVLGRGCVLVSQSGIAGSAKLGDFVSVGGQAGVVGHIKVGDGARIGGQAGVVHNVPAGATMGGSPAIPMTQWLRQSVALGRLVRRKDP